MIEAMACGTPVIAWRCGSVPEVVEHGATGFIVDGLEAAVDAVAKAERLDPTAVRARFEARFTVERMTRDYVRLYKRLAASGPQPARRARSGGRCEVLDAGEGDVQALWADIPSREKVDGERPGFLP